MGKSACEKAKTDEFIDFKRLVFFLDAAVIIFNGISPSFSDTINYN